MSRRYRLQRGQAVNTVKPVSSAQDLGDGAYMQEDKLKEIMSPWADDAIDWTSVYVAPDNQTRDEPEGARLRAIHLLTLPNIVQSLWVLPLCSSWRWASSKAYSLLDMTLRSM